MDRRCSLPTCLAAWITAHSRSVTVVAAPRAMRWTIARLMRSYESWSRSTVIMWLFCLPHLGLPGDPPQPARSAVAQPQPPIKATHVFSPGPHVLRSECQAFGCGVAVSAATMLDLNVREAEHLAASEACRRWGATRGHVHELWLRGVL